MNKHLILNALRRELSSAQWKYEYDKAEAAYYWEHSDKNRPETTEFFYAFYKIYKNRVRAGKAKLSKIRETIRAVKKLP